MPRPRRLPCRPVLLAIPLTLAAPLALAGCGSSGGTATPSSAAPSSAAPSGAVLPAGPAAVRGDLTVLAAASLTGAFPTLGKQFEAAHPGTRVRFSFGGSSALAQQITSGAQADVFASASRKNMDQVVSVRAAEAPRTFAANRAEIAVSPRAASRVHGLADLAAPGLKVALCQPEVPCGALAQQVLTRAGVTVTPVTRGLDVTSVLASVSSGEVDAGIVYVTDVQAAGRSVTGVPVPPEVGASTAYSVATVSSSGNRATARAFEDHVLSRAGQQVLSAAGFAGP